MKRKLLRKDFKYMSRLKYYSFKDKEIGIEIALEPCLNGFCTAIYKLGDIGPFRNKVCTNEKGYGNPDLVRAEISASLPFPRRKKTWDHALKTANKFYTSIKNYIKVRKLGLLPQDGIAYEEDGPESRIFDEIKEKLKYGIKTGPGFDPKGRKV